MSKFHISVFCFIIFFTQEIQASDRFSIEDESWNTPDSTDWRFNILVKDWLAGDIQPIQTSTIETTVNEFIAADIKAKKYKIASYINQVSYLTCDIMLESVCNKDRALIRQMIWNRISLLRMLSNPDCYQKVIETSPSLALFYDNLSQIEKESLNRLHFDTTVPQEQTDTAYSNLKKDCRSFYNLIRSLVPNDLWPVLDEATGEKAIHPYFLNPRSF